MRELLTHTCHSTAAVSVLEGRAVGMVAAKLPRGIPLFRGRYRVRIDAYGGTHRIGVFATVRDARAALEIAKGERARGNLAHPHGRAPSPRHAHAPIRACTTDDRT